MSEPSNTPLQECVRAAVAADQSFVCDSWVRSLLRRGASYDKREAAPLVEMVNRILDRSDTRVLVRHAPTSANEIRAWLVYANAGRTVVAHWAYVRKQFRERGYATSLLGAAGVTPRTAMVFTAYPTGQAGRRLLTCYPLATHIELNEFTGEK